MTKTVLALAIPVMATNLIQTIYGLLDTYFVGKLGTTEIASIQFAWPITFLIISLGSGLSAAATSLVAQYIGAKAYDKAKQVAGQIILITLILSILLGALVIPFLGSFLTLLGLTGEIHQLTYDYLFYNFIGLPAVFMIFAYSGIKNGSGDTVRPMLINLYGVLLAVVLEPILIFVCHLGVIGAALSAVIARGVFSIYGIYKLFYEDSPVQLSKKHFKPDMVTIKKILMLGIPSSFGQSMEALGFLVMNVFIVKLGEATLTAFSIGNRINALIMMPALGIGSALTTMVGQSLGAKDVPRAKKSVSVSIKVSLLLLTLGGIPMILFAKPIVSLFSTDADVITQGTLYLIMITASIPLMGIFNVYAGVFMGAGHTLTNMAIQLSRLWVLRIPMIVVFMKMFPGNPSAIWYSMILSNLVISGVCYGIYKTDRWTVPIN